MNSVLVTPSKLISELCIVHLKLWHQLEIAYDESVSDEEVGKAKRKICQLNTKRTVLENEIDANFKDWLEGKEMYPLFPTIKDYRKHETKKEDDTK